MYWRNNELLTEDLNPPVIYYQQSSCTLNWLSATEIGDVWPKKALVMTRRVLETWRTARRVTEERKHRNFERFSPLVATHTETIELASYKLAARGGEGQEQLWLFWVFRRYCRISIRQNINSSAKKVITWNSDGHVTYKTIQKQFFLFDSWIRKFIKYLNSFSNSLCFWRNLCWICQSKY